LTVLHFNIFINKILMNCDHYKGEFKDHMASGKGIMKYANSDICKGIFENGKLKIGAYIYSNGNYFKGQFENGKLNGIGIQKFIKGNITIGRFKNNKLCGVGKIIKSDGTIYKGHFKNNALHKHGKIIYVNGIVFEGEFKNGSLNGHGKKIFVDGTIYEGYFKNNELIGKCKIIKDNCTYIRDFHNGKMSDSYIMINEVINDSIWNTYDMIIKKISNHNNLCCICIDNTKEYGFNMCGHMCICEKCATALKQKNKLNCPMCQTNGNIIKFFI